MHKGAAFDQSIVCGLQCFELYNEKMNVKVQIFLAVVTAATGSFLQTPSNQFQLSFNSTFLDGNEKLFRPIVIPNATRTPQPHTTVNPNETLGAKENELILKKILQPEESTLRENYLSDEPRPTKFSSRYSTNQDESSGTVQTEKIEKSSKGYSRTTQIPNSEKNEDSLKQDTSTTELHKSFLNSSNDSEEEKEDERREAEESEISPTTNEPYSELQRSTSFQNFDEDHESYETTSAAEEEDSSEEDGSEDKRSVEDYYNSGSKNYHSIQTPLDSIKYRGPHSQDEDFRSERPRTRLVESIRRHPISHKWPYSRAQVKEELEKLNEISDSEESFEKAVNEGIKEEVKTTRNNPDLESAVEKDELKFDRNKKYNYIEERNRRKQQQKGLIAEEEKDQSIPLLEILKQYKVEEEHPKYPPKVGSTPKLKESVRSTNPPHITTPKDIFRTPKKLGVSSDLTLNFQGRDFLGPVVFNQNEKKTVKPLEKNTQRPKHVHHAALKDLEEKEKLDKDNPTNHRFQKSVFGSESRVTQSFNHLEESNEMYNAILANIQSVFGLRTQPLKSGSGTQKVVTEANSAESRSLTWSLPLKSEKVR